VDVTRGARAIGATDLPPFRAAIAAGVPLVMLSHARYPALDPSAIASQSRAIVTGLLKRRLGFKGVAITDSIEAQAVRSRMGPGEAAVRSIRAGADLVLTTGAGSHLRVWRALQRAARRDPAFRARLEDAAARVLALRRSLAR
jgi:beta-N-acetylhexosaminidase